MSRFTFTFTITVTRIGILCLQLCFFLHHPATLLTDAFTIATLPIATATTGTRTPSFTGYHNVKINGNSIDTTFQRSLPAAAALHMVATKSGGRAILSELQFQIEVLHQSETDNDDSDGDGDGDGDGDSDGDGCFRGQIWGRIDDWIHLAKKGSECASISNDNDELIPSMLAEIQTEWIWIQGELRAGSEGYKTNHTKKSKHDQLVVQRAMEFCRGVVFTHMDCQSLNIMTPEHAQDDDDEDDDDDAIADIRLIDFEYAGMNPRAVDLANTFAEFCDMNNLKPAYAAQYPSACVQDVFFMAYIRENDCALAKDLDDMGKVDVELFLLTMRGEVGKNSLLSHLCWSCWALIQFSASSIAFDYITYAKVRLEGYHFFKEKHWPHLY